MEERLWSFPYMIKVIREKATVIYVLNKPDGRREGG